MGEQTTIGALHAAFVRAYEAYNRNDNACLCKIDATEEHIRKDAMSTLDEHTDTLRIAMLREVPQSMADLLLLAFHANTAVDTIASYDLGRHHLNEEANALTVLTENLLAFLVGEAGDSIEPGTWFARQLEPALHRVSARDGQVREAA